MPILKIKRHNAKKEIEFETGYLLSLSVKQRFEMLIKNREEAINLLKKNGYRKSVKIIKRT